MSKPDTSTEAVLRTAAYARDVLGLWDTPNMLEALLAERDELAAAHRTVVDLHTITLTERDDARDALQKLLDATGDTCLRGYCVLDDQDCINGREEAIAFLRPDLAEACSALAAARGESDE